LLYQLFENICSNKGIISKHYLKYGPRSYLYWFQQNLNLYSFNSKDAKHIEKQIKSIRIDGNMGINEINEGFIKLRSQYNDFKPLFQNNYLLKYLGLRTREDTAGITTVNTHAFFAGDFYGMKVPVGYLKSINM
jgi:hypothetical protein